MSATCKSAWVTYKRHMPEDVAFTIRLSQTATAARTAATTAAAGTPSASAPLVFVSDALAAPEAAWVCDAASGLAAALVVSAPATEPPVVPTEEVSWAVDLALSDFVSVFVSAFVGSALVEYDSEEAAAIAAGMMRRARRDERMVGSGAVEVVLAVGGMNEAKQKRTIIKNKNKKVLSGAGVEDWRRGLVGWGVNKDIPPAPSLYENCRGFCLVSLIHPDTVNAASPRGSTARVNVCKHGQRHK